MIDIVNFQKKYLGTHRGIMPVSCRYYRNIGISGFEHVRLMSPWLGIFSFSYEVFFEQLKYVA